jgi:long-chain acyl-CoA synthetase
MFRYRRGRLGGAGALKISTIPELILSACSRPGRADKTALSFAARDGGERFTYGELTNIIPAFARRLLAEGLGPGDRVALMSESRPSWGAAYVGILTAGGTAVPLEPSAGAQEIREILRHSGARRAICSSRTEAVLGEALDEMSWEVDLLRLEELEAAGTGGRVDLPAPGDPGAEAVIIYTSGTTGRPKAVRLSHRNIVSNIHSMTEAIGIEEADVFLSVLPLNHTFECTAGFLVPLSAGASVAYSPSLRPRDLRVAMSSTRPTVMLGVPLLYEKMLNGLHRAVRRAAPLERAAGTLILAAGDAARKSLGHGAARALTGRIREKAGLDRIKYLISGAAALPPSVYDGFGSLGVTLLQGYGLTEASPVVAVNRPEGHRGDTVGVAIPGVELRIDAPGEDGVGELLVSGANVMMGYYGDEEATSEVLSDGWLRTGDIGRIDASGHLRLAGRRKNVIVTSAGKNVYPEEVEERLLDSKFVLEAIVVGRSPGEGRGEQPWAIVFPDRDEIGDFLSVDPAGLRPEEVQSVIKDEIKRLCSGLAEYKRVRGFTLRDEEFPKTSTKKIKRFLFIERNQTV